MAKTPYNFRHVVENIYAGAAPQPEHMPLFKALGIKYVLSLDAKAGDNIAPFLEQNKIHQIYIPLEPSPTINSNLRYLLQNIVKIFQYQPLYIHCLHGSDRTGLVIAAYRVLKYGYTPTQAINEAKKWGYGLGISVQTQNNWAKILSVLAVNKNPTDVASLNDGEISQSLYDLHSLKSDLTSFPYIQSPNAERGTVPYLSQYQENPLSPDERINMLKSYLREENKVPTLDNIKPLILPL